MTSDTTASAPIRVLVVDDDPSIADMHRMFLQTNPRFAVIGVAHTGAAALAAIHTHRPDLVLLDLSLPDMHGLDLLRRLHAASPGSIEIFALTASRDLESVSRARALGVRHYLVKPFNAVVLTARLGEIARHIDTVRASKQTLDQAQVDRLMSATSPRESTAAPKGLIPSVLNDVARELARCGARGASAAELGETIGISRNTTRRYLEHLVESGAAEMSPRLGVPGRPRNMYRAV
ncbi:response regulator [Microbacteriaceae bacterium VKM Ac-2855]|nr:response regulator [Microbacteriaceae bacterium VKM Ac-2855]